MKNVLPIAAIALLLSANKLTSNKRKIRLTYDCYRGCAMDNPFGSGCWVRDYDWTVTASIPVQDSEMFQTKAAAEAFINNNPDIIEVIKFEPYKDDPTVRQVWYHVIWLTYESRIIGLRNLQNSTSQSWSFSNTEAFYAEQAQKMIAKSYGNLETSPYGNRGLLNLSDYEPEVIYTKEFNECAEKDMNLNILADIVKAWVVNYLKASVGIV